MQKARDAMKPIENSPKMNSVEADEFVIRKKRR